MLNKQEETLLKELLNKYKQGYISGLIQGDNINLTPSGCRNKIISSTGGGGSSYGVEIVSSTRDFRASDVGKFLVLLDGVGLTMPVSAPFIEKNKLIGVFAGTTNYPCDNYFERNPGEKVYMCSLGYSQQQSNESLILISGSDFYDTQQTVAPVNDVPVFLNEGDTVGYTSKRYFMDIIGSGGSTQIAFTKTKAEIDALIAGNDLVKNALYEITGVHPTLYDDGTTSGTTVYLRAISGRELEVQGMGKFYNPKYNQAVNGFGIWDNKMYGTFSGIVGTFDYQNKEAVTANNSATGILLADGMIQWVSGDWSAATSITGDVSGATANIADFVSPSYGIGDKVIWGGYSWTNVNGNIGASVDVLNLDAEWTKNVYDTTNYNIAYDVIEYDYANDMIIRRFEKESNVDVKCSKAQYDFFVDNYGIIYHAISVQQFGNEFKISISKGQLNIDVDNGYNESVNFSGEYQNNLTFGSNAFQNNLTFGISAFQNNLTFDISAFQRYLTFGSGAYQQNLTFGSGAYQEYLTFDSGGAYQNNLTFGNYAFQSYLTFGSGAYQEYLTFDSGAFQNNLTFGSDTYQGYLTFGIYANQQNLTFGNYANQNNLTFGNYANQQNLTFGNYANQNNLTFGSNAFQNNLTFGISAFQNNLTFDIGANQQYLTFDISAYQNNLTFGSGAYQEYLTFDSGAYQNNLTFDISAYQGNLTFGSGAGQRYLTFGISAFQQSLTFGNYANQNNLTFGSNANQEYLTFDIGAYQNNLTFGSGAFQQSLTFGNYAFQQYLNFAEKTQLNFNNQTLNSNIQYVSFRTKAVIVPNLSSATYIYDGNIKEVYQRPDGTLKLKYMNDSDVLVVNNITD